MATPEQSDAHKMLEGNPRRFFRIPSRSPSRADRNPQSDVDERHKNVIQDSTALAVTVAAPPSRILMVVTMNSAKNRIPPEDPTNWPMRMNPTTRVLRRRGFAKDKTPLDVVRRTISIDSIVRLIPWNKGSVWVQHDKKIEGRSILYGKKNSHMRQNRRKSLDNWQRNEESKP